jgi:hypothetical protein
MSKFGNFMRGVFSTGSQVGAATMDSAKTAIRTGVENTNFNNSVNKVGNSVDQGITAGHEIAALMQKLSLAAAEDSATKKAGEQVKSAAQ